ncbi:hypothetical protein E0F15_16250 [Frankia sp. B2]|uniref:hypothetical protein n=1 Tax=unclassified Frankia TaxID=2632575 RepID=UPI000461BB34|nr:MULTISPECIES: hypothetical protein [unclassified Frankia]KDA41683.1 hypothetical protein BMG523Draft_03501 [Frankia sp. BMG5.23]TFE27618.1 hypothetical protein E0F15_16250 [Frankia sp. B2]
MRDHGDKVPERLVSLPADPRPVPVLVIAQPSPPASGVLPRWAVFLATGTALVVGWAAAVWTAAHLTADPTLHTAALFVHLAALVGGFGAVLAIDFFALSWLFGRRSFPDVIRVASGLHVMIWAGLAGLVLSGILLHPDLSRRLTQVKIGLVLLIALNGLHIWAIQHRLEQSATVPSRALLARSIISNLLSQAGWWGAMVIGYLASQD